MAKLLPKLCCAQEGKKWQSCPVLYSSLTPLPICGMVKQTCTQNRLYSTVAVKFWIYWQFPSSELYTWQALHTLESWSFLCSLQQCLTQLLLCLFPGPVPSPFFQWKKTHSVHTATPRYLHDKHWCCACLIALWENWEQAESSTQALLCYISGKWGTFLTKNRYWLKLAQSNVKNVDTQNWGAINVLLGASGKISKIHHIFSQHIYQYKRHPWPPYSFHKNIYTKPFW